MLLLLLLTPWPWLVSSCTVAPLGHCPAPQSLGGCLVGQPQRSGLWKEDAASIVQPAVPVLTTYLLVLPATGLFLQRSSIILSQLSPH